MSSGEPARAKANKQKVKVRLVPVGNAPILRNSKLKLSSVDRLSKLDAYIRRQLQLGPGDSLFLYVNQVSAGYTEQEAGNRGSFRLRILFDMRALFNTEHLPLLSQNLVTPFLNLHAQAFQPRLDQEAGELFGCFNVGGELVVNYGTTGAWG